MNKKIIPEVVIERLPKYYRYFGNLLGQKEKVSSKELSEILRCSASQIRHDLSYFGEFGLQGYGYNVEDLYNKIGKLLGVDKKQKFIIIGAGSLGKAIANYPVFKEMGFRLIGLFDNNPEKIGSEIAGSKISDVNELEIFIKKKQPCIAILTTPINAVPSIAGILKEGGIKAIMNFTPMDLHLSEDIPVKNIHLTDKILSLSYVIKNKI